MAELKDYPFVNQLNSPTLDGGPDNNKWFNCVVCSILSAMFYWKPELRGKLSPDEMKDAVYGDGYQSGGTDAAYFVNFVARYGLKLYNIQNMPGKLIEEAHRLIQAGKPAIFTEIDPYCTDAQRALGWTHVCSWYKEIPGPGLDAMDPFGGKLVGLPDTEWMQKIVGNELWTVEPMEEEMITIDINNPEIAKHFKEVKFPDGHIVWECTDEGPWQGKIIQYAMLENYKTEGNKGLCGYDVLGRPMYNEKYLGKDYSIQFYENGVRQWRNGKITPVPLYDNGPGQDPLVAQLEKMLSQSGSALAAIKQIQTLVKPF